MLVYLHLAATSSPLTLRCITSDWQDDLTCYYIQEKWILYCSWLPLHHPPDSLVYTVFLKWEMSFTFQHKSLSVIPQVNNYVGLTKRYTAIRIAIQGSSGSSRTLDIELTEKPAILENAPKKISQGKISIFLKWKTSQSRNTIGYYINIERIPRYCPYVLTYLNVTENWVHLNLSMAYYRIKISAYNEAGESPPLTYLVPDFTTTDLPGQINVSNQQNYTVISWNLKYKSHCIVIDWGTGLEDMTIRVSSWRNKTQLNGLQPYRLYKVTLHAFDCECEDFVKHEWTLARTYFYAVEGVPQIGPTNVTIAVVTKHSAVVKWNEIPAEERLGFLQGYRICYTDILKNLSVAITVSSSAYQYLMTELKAKTLYKVHITGFTSKGEGVKSQPQLFTTLKYDPGEFEGSVAGLCLAIMMSMVAVATLCSLILKRSRKLFWPAMPNPRYSTAILSMERTIPVVLLEPSSHPLPQSQPSNGPNKLYVVENDSQTPSRQGSLSRGIITVKVSAEHSERLAGVNADTALNPLKIPDKVNASDYIGVDVGHKAMQKLSESTHKERLSTKEVDQQFRKRATSCILSSKSCDGKPRCCLVQQLHP
ncbi:interleukin-6 receptor subunit beta-like [Rhineura floridana]|uniref:interleukin-6 receptor subunit beta-like n=1 Tax=Rhineura floridana TaxID=261503 RepID=UPI002AC7ECB4|nr:interleukin-6 receptor subunit beta-like [Rhineura floridana]